MSILRKGQAFTSATAATTTSLSGDVEVAGASTLTVLASVTGGASGDITLTVRAYDDLGALFDLALTPQAVTAPALAGGLARTIQQFDVRGLEKVQVRVTNNNAGTQTLAASYLTGH